MDRKRELRCRRVAAYAVGVAFARVVPAWPLPEASEPTSSSSIREGD